MVADRWTLNDRDMGGWEEKGEGVGGGITRWSLAEEEVRSDIALIKCRSSVAPSASSASPARSPILALSSTAARPGLFPQIHTTTAMTPTGHFHSHLHLLSPSHITSHRIPYRNP